MKRRPGPAAAGAGQQDRYAAMMELWGDALAFVRKNGTTYPVRAPSERGRPGRILYFREWPQAVQLRSINAQLLAIERAMKLAPRRTPAATPDPGLFT